MRVAEDGTEIVRSWEESWPGFIDVILCGAMRGTGRGGAWDACSRSGDQRVQRHGQVVGFARAASYQWSSHVL